MPNRNYNKGSNFERLTKAYLESEEGWFCVRSSGSHGPVDVLCVDQKGKAKLIQCKLHGMISKQARSDLYSLAAKYKAKAFLARKVKGKLELVELGKLGLGEQVVLAEGVPKC